MRPGPLENLEVPAAAGRPRAARVLVPRAAVGPGPLGGGVQPRPSPGGGGAPYPSNLIPPRPPHELGEGVRRLGDPSQHGPQQL
jgi:hypothetical protein